MHKEINLKFGEEIVNFISPDINYNQAVFRKSRKVVRKTYDL